MIDDREVWLMYKDRKPGDGFCDLVDYPGYPAPPEYYAIRFYREQYDKLTKFEQHAAMAWAQEALVVINQFIPISLEVWQSKGRRK